MSVSKVLERLRFWHSYQRCVIELRNITNDRFTESGWQRRVGPQRRYWRSTCSVLLPLYYHLYILPLLYIYIYIYIYTAAARDLSSGCGRLSFSRWFLFIFAHSAKINKKMREKSMIASIFAQMRENQRESLPRTPWRVVTSRHRSYLSTGIMHILSGLSLSTFIS